MVAVGISEAGRAAWAAELINVVAKATRAPAVSILLIMIPPSCFPAVNRAQASLVRRVDFALRPGGYPRIETARSIASITGVSAFFLIAVSAV